MEMNPFSNLQFLSVTRAPTKSETSDEFGSEVIETFSIVVAPLNIVGWLNTADSSALRKVKLASGPRSIDNEGRFALGVDR